MRRLLCIIVFMVITPALLRAQISTIDVSYRQYEVRKKESMAKLLLASEFKLTDNQGQFDVTYYFLDLIPDPEKKLLMGKVQIDLVVLSDQLDRIELNFYSGMTIDSLYVTHHSSLSLNYYQGNDLLTIDLDRSYVRDERVSISIVYRGKPQESRYYSFGFDQSGSKPMIWTLSEPFGARAWWPCKDVPSDKADSVDIRVTVPSELIVASNGTLREKVELGEKTVYWWHEGYPIATYLVSLAIYPYKVYYDDYLYNDGADTMKIHFYVFPDNYTRYRDANGKVKDMIRCYANLFGEYPFVKEKYGQADFLGGGAMEHQTCSSFAFWGDIVYAHELAHQWWGDLITCADFHHIWLNEGFATYSEALWYEHLYGPGSASLYQMSANLYLGDGTIYVEDPLHDSIFDGGLSYSKASWVLHMLRHIVGDEQFFTILRTYYNDPVLKFGSATTDDFKKICENVSGMDLSKFFQQWIYDEHYPEFSYYWLSEKLDDDNYRIYGVVNQLQTKGPEAFNLPVDLTIRTASNDTMVVLSIDERSESYEFFVKDEPRDVVLDKGNWILKTSNKIQRPDIVLTGIYINDTDFNNNKKAEPGETIDVYVDLKNQGLNVTNLQLRLVCSDPCVTILNDRLTIDEIEIGATVSTGFRPFSVLIAADAMSHLVEFQLNVTGDFSYTKTIPLHVAVGYPQILFVDDDAENASDRIISRFLNDSKIFYDTWSIAAYGLPSDLSHYKVLIWATGDDRTTTLTTHEQKILSNYLDAGGKLFISGQNIGYDLVEAGTSADSLFYTDYLKAEYIRDSADDPWIIGDTDDELGKQLYVFLIGIYGSNFDQQSTDVIMPIEDADSFLIYAMTKQCAGIYYENEHGARVVYIPFGIEGIAGPNPTSASLLVTRVMDWLSNDSTVSDIKDLEFESIAPRVELYDNFPNPFNPETTIGFNIPQESRVALAIYNILGEEIITLIDHRLYVPGSYRVTWNGVNRSGDLVQSGIYLYKLECSGVIQTKKMLFLK